jgi:hypothetical protein
VYTIGFKDPVLSSADIVPTHKHLRAHVVIKQEIVNCQRVASSKVTSVQSLMKFDQLVYNLKQWA